MDHQRLLAVAQELLRQFQMPGQLQEWQQALTSLAELLQRRAELTEQLRRIEDDTRRAQAESASRLTECREQEVAATRRTVEAVAAGEREIATLAATREQLKGEVTGLYQERQAARDALQGVRDEHALTLTALARERGEATRALETARAALTKLRETLPP